MYIERLHLKGFKSFGASLDMPFSPGFTAIVGPNGSGKSNLLDALRWVLGEAGVQRLRISKQSDLLFSGSVTLPPASRAEVSLTLCAGEEPVAQESGNRPPDASRCLIKRTYSPDTGTVLTVDGVRVRLSDLDEVKRLWRLEGDQFAFIGQGEVAEAIHQRPSQRRTHLEVLFGIDQYRKKRNETSQKLASASEETLRLGALTAELSNRRMELAPAVEKASLAKKISDQLEEKRRGYYFFRRRFLEDRCSAVEEELARLRKEEALRLRWKDLWEAMYNRSVLRSAELGESAGSLMAERDELTARREGLRRSCFASAASIREIMSRRRSLGEERAVLSSRLDTLAAEKVELKGKETSLERECRSLEDEGNTLRRKVRELHESIETERRKRNETSAALAALSGEKEALQSRMLSRRAFLEACAADLETSEEAVRSLEQSLRDSSEALSALEKREPELLERHNEAFARCRTTAGGLQQARKEFSLLESSLEDLRNSEESMYPEPVRFLTAASRLGKLSVPVKVAAESFTCPSRITSALEAYLGGRQYWILVRTLAEAGECIDMLKDRRAGRATFLPLERSRPRFPQSRFILPAKGMVGWAMELISPDPEWEQAVAHILGDLLVVERYDDGAALVRNGASFPMVSLEGEVFAPSGTVSGGKVRVSEGAIERRSRIAASEEKLRSLKKRISELSRSLNAEEAEERRCAAEKEECSRRIRELRKETEGKTRELALETAKKERLRAENASGIADIEAWEARRASLEIEMKTLEKSVVPSSDSGELSALPSRLAEIESSFALLEERLSSVRALRERAEDELARGEARARSLDEDESLSSLREKQERERLSNWGEAQYRIFLDLRAKNEKLSLLGEKERRQAVRSVRISSRSKTAAEKAATVRVKAESLVQQLGNLAEERERLVEAWEEQHPYDRNSAPGPDEGEAIAAAVRKLERDLRALAPVDWGALSEDNSLTERVSFLQDQLSDVHAAMDELRSIIEETDRHVGIVFNNALTNINMRFDALFRRLFGGGEARIQLLVPHVAAEPDETGEDEAPSGRDPQDRRNRTGEDSASSAAWDQGVEIVARPPGKHLQNLAQLSGGEQTLTAIAYLFASMEVAGVPLAVLDEVDAALDESNLLRFGELAREYACPSESSPSCGGIQLLVMTHRRATMERADILYGVTLSEPGLSKVLGIKVDDWVETPAVPLRTNREAVAYARREQP